MPLTYKPLDACWIELRGREGLHAGTVLLQFYLSSDQPPFYIIKINDHAWTTLEVRDGLLMSPKEGELPPVSLAQFEANWPRIEYAQ